MKKATKAKTRPKPKENPQDKRNGFSMFKSFRGMRSPGFALNNAEIFLMNYAEIFLMNHEFI